MVRPRDRRPTKWVHQAIEHRVKFSRGLTTWQQHFHDVIWAFRRERLNMHLNVFTEIVDHNRFRNLRRGLTGGAAEGRMRVGISA